MHNKNVNNKNTPPVNIIGGSDGPTSVFLASASTNKRKSKAKRKKKIRKLASEIETGTHSLKEVEQYMVEKYGAELISESDPHYLLTFKNMKAGLILEYRPDLLKTSLQGLPKDSMTEEDWIEYMNIMRKRQEEAENMPDDLFPISVRAYHISLYSNEEQIGDINIEIEEMNDQLLVSGSGSQLLFSYKKNPSIKLLHRQIWRQKRKKTKAGKIIKDIYCYYGVSKEDIDNRTKRFYNLINAIEYY